ncbi:hypothetical protein H9Q13_07735 [Pontibacter sp. JH31]|uniref:Uncharacterized protein n=1 Tax=Pontibacter aquaedesilientis TaxID=2766980 RepID=A0ABR7XFH5_9BACT|nr:hypothetical protein [Pontibacter aquaedesilientis]MBD1397053.1 hypothetical protein [Pontibacter aquaedesilientis]
MNSAIAIFFASLVSGVMSLTELRPTFSDVVQILTGVELEPQEEKGKDQEQQVYKVPASQHARENCRTALYSQASGTCGLPQANPNRFRRG